MATANGENVKLSDFEKSKISDLKNEKVPEVLYWSVDDVCHYFESELKLPEYKETLRSNGIDGRRLIYLDASHLPKIGVNDYKHIMHITKNVRNLMKMNDPYWNRSISLIPRDPLELYLEAKSVRGANSDKKNFEEFEPCTRDNTKWEPVLTNQGFIMPSY